eukprot:918897_1
MNYKSVGILVLVACLVSTATATGASKKDLRFKGSGKRISDGVDLDSHGGGSCGGQCKCLCVERFLQKHGSETCNGTELEEWFDAGVGVGENFTYASIGDLAGRGFCFTRIAYKGTLQRFETGCTCPNKRLVSNTPGVIGFYIYCDSTTDDEGEVVEEHGWLPGFPSLAKEPMMGEPIYYCADRDTRQTPAAE